MPVFGVRRHVAAFKARTCPRTPKSQRDAWNYSRRFAISTTICAAKQRNSSNRSAVAMICVLSGARARATSADSENADSQEEQKVKRDPDAELDHISSRSHLPDFPAGCSI